MRYMVRSQLDDLTAMQSRIDLIVTHNKVLGAIDTTL